MTKRISAGLTIVAILLIALPAAVHSRDEKARGKELYYAHGCYGCHGYNGETGARALVGTDSPIIADVDTFLLYLRARTDYLPLLPSTRMPAYPESALSNADARDIFAYISEFELNAPEVDDIPALQEVLDSASRQLEE